MRWIGLEPARFLSREAGVLPGVKGILAGVAPAAGSEIVVTVPGGQQWRLQAGHFQFTASAAVANRNIQWVVTVDGVRVWRTLDGTAAVAGNTRFETIMPAEGLNFQAANTGVSVIAHPPVWLPPGSTFGTSTLGLDAGDQYSNVGLYVEQVYVSDQKLDEIAELEQREYYDALRKAGVHMGA